MRKMDRFKKALTLCLAAVMLTGCGEKAPEDKITSADIELINPVNAVANTEIVTYKDMYQYKTYTGVVYPEVYEYAFEKNVSFSQFLKFPGETVKKGEVLVKAENTSLQKQIESSQEALENMDEQYASDIENYDEQIADKQETIDEKDYRARIVIGEAEMLRRQISFYELEIKVLERKKEERTALYNLERGKLAESLDTMLKDKKQETLISVCDGTVAAIGDYSEGDNVSAEVSVIAVANEDKKIVKCEYIAEKNVNDAARVFYMADGKQYNVTYIPYEESEYNSLVAKGATLVSTFVIDDPDDELSFGEHGIITLIEKEIKDCVAVPKSAIHKDEGGFYVYTLVDNKNVKNYIVKGYTDGVYTEIIDGVKNGDAILLSGYTSYGANRQELKKGDFSTDYSGSGYLNYPDYSLLNFEIEHGKAKLEEVYVQMFSMVKKGDPIARISIEEDEIMMTRLNLQLQELIDRREDLVIELNDPEANRQHEQNMAIYEKILDKDEEISELQQEINEIKESYNNTIVYADTDGLVFYVTDKKPGSDISDGESVLLTAALDKCFLSLNNDKNLLQYGNVINVEYTDGAGNKFTTEGKVVSLSGMTLSSGLTSSNSYIQLDDSVREKFAPTVLSMGGNAMRASYDASGTPKKISNVVLVPKAAVTTENGQNYVHVVDENGNITAVSFISGGNDAFNYWVIEGLEEGMTVCLE